MDDKPSVWSTAEISLYFWGISETFNLTVCLIEENWNEYSITYISKPTRGAVITYLIVPTSGYYTIDITDYIAGRSNISVSLYFDTENYISDNAYISSREDSNIRERPQILWDGAWGEINITYPEATDEIRYGAHKITWTSAGSIGSVLIELYKGVLKVDDISGGFSTSNDGEYIWRIYSTDDFDGDDYRIKISDYNNPDTYGFSDNFTVLLESEDGGFSFRLIHGYNGVMTLIVIIIPSIYWIKKERK